MAIDARDQTRRNDNRVTLLILAALIVVAILGYTAYAAYQSNKNNGVYNSVSSNPNIGDTTSTPGSYSTHSGTTTGLPDNGPNTTPGATSNQ